MEHNYVHKDFHHNIKHLGMASTVPYCLDMVFHVFYVIALWGIYFEVFNVIISVIAVFVVYYMPNLEGNIL